MCSMTNTIEKYERTQQQNLLVWRLKFKIRRNEDRETGLHKLRYPGIRDMSTWSKFGAHGEHGDVFLFSNLGAL